MTLKRSKAENDFVAMVWHHYSVYGRHTLPWRHTKDPYRILVSELMLQQTQVARVIPKYEAFIAAFPDTRALAAASLKAVLTHWQGLGYNRRARFLHEAAKQVVAAHDGMFPKEPHELITLPGVGPYTAGAIAAFAFDAPVVLIETNIRTAYIHHFFDTREGVTDQELVPYLTRTMEAPSAHWYAALMDYGSFLKTTVGNKNTQSVTYKPQSRFSGSDRQIRGRIISLLVAEDQSLTALKKRCAPEEALRVTAQLKALRGEGLVVKAGRKYTLPKK